MSDICATAGCFAYASGAGPHALTSIAGTYNGVVNPTFAYDANGVMTSGAGRTVTPTAFNMAASIVDGSNTAAIATTSTTPATGWSRRGRTPGPPTT